MTAYIVESIYYGDDGTIIFNNKDVEETAEQSIDLSGYIQKSGDAMTGTLLVPQLTFSDATIQSSAFTEELKESVQDMQSVTQYINYDGIDGGVHVLVPLQLQDELRFQDGSTMISATNTPNTAQITYNTQTMVTSIANTTYVSNLTAGNINTAHLADTTSSLQSQINALSSLITSLQSSAVPCGTVLSYSGVTAPSGYALCEGQQVSRTGIYANLFALVGHKFQAGKTLSSGMFFLPDLRGMFIRGTKSNGTYNMKTQLDSNFNVSFVPTIIGEEAVGAFQTHEVADHFHIYEKPSTTITVASEQIANNNASVWDNKTTDTFTTTLLEDDNYFNDRIGDETRPVNLALTYIIKL